MQYCGYRFVNHTVCIGLHDYEQDYPDLFRKVPTHTIKHREFLPYLSALWNAQAAKGDSDALFCRHVLRFAKNVKINALAFDKNEFSSLFDDFCRQHTYTAKAPLANDPSTFVQHEIDRPVEKSAQLLHKCLQRKIKLSASPTLGRRIGAKLHKVWDTLRLFQQPD